MDTVRQTERQHTEPPPIIFGRSKEAVGIRKFVDIVGHVSQTVFLSGERGTGKDLIAKAIHHTGRATKQFVPVDCGGLPHDLVESELFGHHRGAYSGAYETKRGLVEVASGGTLFFNEIANLPQSLQVKLLRVMEKGSYRMLGTTAEIYVNTRFIVATNADLKDKVRRGEFRADLFDRLNVIPYKVPPLRERLEDVPELATHFLGKESGKAFLPTTMLVMEQYGWPGNVRELQNTVERASVFSNGNGLIGPELVEPYLAADCLQTEPVDQGEHENEAFIDTLVRKTFPEMERLYYESIMFKTRGHIAKAAKIAGISPRVLGYRLKNLGLSGLASTLKES